MEFIITWLIITLAVVITAYILPGAVVAGFVPALMAGLAIGVINAFVKPILLVLTLPLNILTLGLFTFILNALLIMIVSAIIPGFKVNGFWWALLFSIVLSVVYYLINSIVKL